MDETRVLDSSLIKDLSNNIYEKRKATAFQIESLTKSALARNDSQTIYKIISELTELTNSGTNSAKMGAITALGSVSVALGSFAIAYFLEDIVKPIFATFRDTDARVRYYACESLYNIAKIARGEILLYLNEVFDILCILVTDTESSVKNAADILDRLIKDIVSAKSTNYVSILKQQDSPGITSRQSNEIPSHIVNADGVAIQVNEVQGVQKAFSLPKFIPTLLERMYIIDPFAKKFLISWLELLDDIPSLELISFLPNFLEPLMKFLMNSAPSDVRLETKNILNEFLKEIKSIARVKKEVKRRALKAENQKKRLASEQNHNDSDVTALSSEDKNGDEHEDKKRIGSGSSSKDKSLSDDTKSIDSTHSYDVEDDNASRHSSESLTPSDGQLFLSGQDIFIDYPKIIDILLSFVRLPKALKGKNQEYKVNSIMNENHEIYLEIQTIALQWLQEILVISPISFTKFLPDCVSVNMKNISISDDNNDSNLRGLFLKFNLSLQSFLVNLHEAAQKEEQGKNINVDKKTPDHKDKDLGLSGDISVGFDDSNEDENDENIINGLTKEVYDEFLEFYLTPTLKSVMNECLTCSNELSRLTLLDFLIFLYTLNPSSFLTPSFSDGGVVSEDAFDVTSLLRSSIDASKEVILKVLQLLSKISETDEKFFKLFIMKLMLFCRDEISDQFNDKKSLRTTGTLSFTRTKIELIIRKLCVTLNSEKIFKTLSEVVASFDGDMEFLSTMVVTLNNILITAQELAWFRKKLKNLDTCKIEDWHLFASLFQSWCHNPPSALSLCLLTSNYELAYLIIKSMSDLEVSFETLAQLDILVQLLESPIFMKLRLQLLEPEKFPYLYKTLYGVLMILPQSSTFTTLKNRLSSVSSVNNLTLSGVASASLTTPVNTPGPSSVAANNSSISSQLSIRRKRIYEMLDKFNKVQEKHNESILAAKLGETSLDAHESKKAFSLQSTPINERTSGNTLDSKDYFSATHANPNSLVETRNAKRLSSNRFKLGKFHGSS